MLYQHEKNIYNAISVNSGKENYVVYSTYEKETDIFGHIFISNLNNESEKLTQECGDYEDLSAVYFYNKFFISCTNYENRGKSINLIVKGDTTKIINITPNGKYDKPYLCTHNDKVYLFWSKLENDSSCIEYVIIEPTSLSYSNPAKITDTEERAYSPKAISCNGDLVIGYEAYFKDRYNLIFRVLNIDSISKPINAGLCKNNDKSLSLFAYNNEVYYCFENSSALDTDYKWLEPTGRIITMPSFGHGWRVFTKTHIRKLHIDKGIATIEQPICKNKLCENESDGEGVIFVYKNAIYLAYLSLIEDYAWNINIKTLDGDSFKTIKCSDMKMLERKQPVLSLNDDKLFVYGFNNNNEYVSLDMKKINLSQCENNIKYEKISEINIDSSDVSTAFIKPSIQTIEYDKENLSLYFGDLHMHSNISTCSLNPKFHCTNIYDKHQYSRNVGNLDFDLLTDHETMSDLQWYKTKKSAHLANIDNHYVSFVGFEWTSTMRKNIKNYGHYNVLYIDDGDIRRIDNGNYKHITELWESLEVSKALTIPHHPSEEIHPLDWNYFNKDFEPLVEIYQVRGSYEADGCHLDPNLFGRKTKKNNSVQVGLNKGYRFGFTSGGEHEGVGLTGVYAKKLTRESIFDALVKRRTFGTTSKRFFVDFRINNSLFGSEIDLKSNTVLLDIKLKGTAKIKSVTLVTPEKDYSVEHENGMNINISREFTFNKIPSWVYLRIIQEDDNALWTSPIWTSLA